MPPAKQSAVKSDVASLSSAKRSAIVRKPPKKGIIAIVAGGLGAAAMAKRRRGEKVDEIPMMPPVRPVEHPNAPTS